MRAKVRFTNVDGSYYKFVIPERYVNAPNVYDRIKALIGAHEHERGHVDVSVTLRDDEVYELLALREATVRIEEIDVLKRELARAQKLIHVVRRNGNLPKAVLDQLSDYFFNNDASQANDRDYCEAGDD